MFAKYHDAAELKGKTLARIEEYGKETLKFFTACGKVYTMAHEQDGCERVEIHDITGDLLSLIGSSLVVACESVSTLWPEDVAHEPNEWEDSYTWTVYRLETASASVSIRWHGQSNGYYSESVQISEGST